MTKKDYCKFAGMLMRLSNAGAGLGETGQNSENFKAGYYCAINNAAEMMADILKADNPRFDQGRFLKACGIE